jgi:hypothetical protein
MTERPHLTPKKSAEADARTERLAKALRENLRRRKEQARAQQKRAFDRSIPSGEGEPTA